MGQFSGGITGLLGGAFGSKSELYGRKYKIPDEIDYSESLKDAVKTNQELLPYLSKFAQMSTEEMTNVMEVAFPGYKGIRDKASEVTRSFLGGEVPADVQHQLERQAAEKGQTLGYGGSQFGDNQFLRNFGMTSLQLTQQGLTSAASWMNAAQNTSFDFSKFFLGKEEAIRRDEFNWNRELAANQIKAAPDPRKRGAFDSEMALIGMVLGVCGGPGYQNTYRQTETQPVGGDGDPRNQGYFGGGPAYGSTYRGAGGNTYVSVGTDTPGGGMSVPLYNPGPGGPGYSSEFYSSGPQ